MLKFIALFLFLLTPALSETLVYPDMLCPKPYQFYRLPGQPLYGRAAYSLQCQPNDASSTVWVQQMYVDTAYLSANLIPSKQPISSEFTLTQTSLIYQNELSKPASLNQIKNSQTKRAIPKNTPILLKDLEPLILWRTGELVRVLFFNQSISFEQTYRATNPGKINQTHSILINNRQFLGLATYCSGQPCIKIQIPN